MQEANPSNIELIRAGVARVGKDFGVSLAPLGFTRTKKMLWSRQHGESIESIGMLRLGAAGKPLTASVRLRLDFFVRRLNGEVVAGTVDEGPLLSDHLRDSEGYAYHLRFNASSWSTYDRCVADLLRIVQEHGVPWFAQRRANSTQ